MNLKDSSFHVPIDPAFAIVKTLDQRPSQFFKSSVQCVELAHIPGGHIDRNTAYRKRVLAFYELGDKTLGNLIFVKRCEIARQRPEDLCVRPARTWNASLGSDHCLCCVFELITNLEHAHYTTVETQNIERLSQKYGCSASIGVRILIKSMVLFILDIKLMHVCGQFFFVPCEPVDQHEQIIHGHRFA